MRSSSRPATPGDALERLLEGNARFVSGSPEHGRRESARLAEVAEEQAPFAVVLTCADSRVPAEVVFDQGFGDLFVVRVAGNTASDPIVIGSVQFAVEQLGCILVFVLGHSGCGAVQGAIDVVVHGAKLSGDIQAVVAPILPSVEEVRGDDDADLSGNAIRANVRRTITGLCEVDIIRELADREELVVAGGEYDLQSGTVTVVR